MTKPSVIRAAGVVLLRERKGKTEVCVLHRPRQKDWSLPKGKIENGEHVVAAALRETIEETRSIPVLGVPLMTNRYRVNGQPKTVRYWVGRTGVKDNFKPNNEIDKLEWLNPDKAAKRLTYQRDTQLMRAAVEAPQTFPLVIVRHAHAMRRADWKGSRDDKRPLTTQGQREAKILVDILEAFGVTYLYSSDSVRCVDTLTPFSNRNRVSIRLENEFSEEGFESDPDSCYKRLNGIVNKQEPIALCSHRPVLPAMIKQLSRKLGMADSDQLDPALPPGGFIVLHREFHPKKGLRISAIERHTL